MLCSELPETVLCAALLDSAQIGGGEVACSGNGVSKIGYSFGGEIKMSILHHS